MNRSLVRRAVAHGLALALGLAQLGCVRGTTDATPALIDVAGAWSYAGFRTGSGALAAGTLTLSQDGTTRVSGTFDASEQDAAGNVRRIVGAVSGRTVGDATVAFDVVFDPTASRHHTGTVRGDSLIGSWVELTDRGVVASGSFRARRVRTP